MSYCGEIPGHYYDEEKKKYFAIMPDHLAPAGATYSQTAVDKRKEEQKLQLEKLAREAKLRSQPVQRSKVLSSALAGGVGVIRETAAAHSLARNVREVTTNAYAAGLEKRWGRSGGLLTRSFDYDHATGSLLIGVNPDNGLGYLTAQGPLRHHGLDRGEAYVTTPLHNPITAVSISPSRVAMATSMGGQTGASILIAPLTDPSFSPLPTSTLTTQYTINHADCWTCAANPFLHAQTTFAASILKKVVLYSDTQGQWAETQNIKGRHDVFAVEWMTPTLLSIGTRNGHIRLWDTRSNGSALRLEHKSRVSGIRRASPETLVVCGIPDALDLYDLRMPKAAAEPARGPSPKTQSAIQYDFKSSSVQPGFDIDPATNTVAAVDGKAVVQLWSLKTGEGKKSVPLFEREAGRAELVNLSALRFCGGEPGLVGVGVGVGGEVTGDGQLVVAAGGEMFGIGW